MLELDLKRLGYTNVHFGSKILKFHYIKSPIFGIFLDANGQCPVVYLLIICLTGYSPGYKSKNCWKQDCDGTETKTEFKLETDRDCSGKLTTTVKVTAKNGQEKTYQKPALCRGPDCQLPDCPDHDEKICRG